MIDLKANETTLTRSLDSADQALDSASRVIAGVRDHAAPSLNQTAARFNEVAQQGMDAVRHLSEEVAEQARRASYKTTVNIRNAPIRSVLIAAAVGACTMALYGLLRKRSRQAPQ